MDIKTVQRLEVEFAQEQQSRRANTASGVILGAAVAGGVATLALPASAQTATGIAEVSSTVTALGGIASACVTIAVVAFGARLAFKMANRVMTKG